MVETGETLANDGSTVNVVGLSTINNLRILRGLLSAYKARDTFEIGLAYGASAFSNSWLSD
jgi:hypothetical protein